MQLSPYYHVVNVLLAVLLGVNSICLQGFGHVHVDGDKSHGHTSKAIAELQDCCCEHSLHEHHLADDYKEPGSSCGSCLAALPVSHTHLSIFGFDFSIPDSEDSQDDNDSHLLVFVRLTDDCTIVLVGRSIITDTVDQALLTTNVADFVATDVRQSSTAQVPAPPLCDSARFERSGVLLA